MQALEDLHVKKVIHRDVKPSNMLVDKCGKFKVLFLVSSNGVSSPGIVLQLCDFGISGKLKDSLVQTAVGTNAYLAPERIAPLTHGEPYSIISDVWSLGLSILEVAEMRFPFSDAQSLMSQLNDIVINPPPQLSPTSPYHRQCPELNEFIRRTLVRPPAERYRYVQLKSLKLIDQFNDSTRFNEAQEKLSTLVIKYNKWLHAMIGWSSCLCVGVYARVFACLCACCHGYDHYLHNVGDITIGCRDASDFWDFNFYLHCVWWWHGELMREPGVLFRLFWFSFLTNGLALSRGSQMKVSDGNEETQFRQRQKGTRDWNNF